jgi:putative hydrolase of the HAD superfamily
MPLALFDLDNTLIQRNVGFLRWVHEFTAQRDLPPGAVNWFVEADGDGFTPRADLLAAAIERFDLPDEAPALLAAYQERMPDVVDVRPAVLAALDALRTDGWRVGIVTNGDADGQWAKIERVGLPAHVDGWAISGAEGVRKPDPALFALAAARCGGSLADGGWMVGDSREADIAGGRAAGLRTIWIRGCGPQTGGAEPDHAVDDVLPAFALITAAIGSAT